MWILATQHRLEAVEELVLGVVVVRLHMVLRLMGKIMGGVPEAGPPCLIRYIVVKFVIYICEGV